MIVITGGAGFLGSNIIRALNAKGETRILVVERLESPTSSINLASCRISDCISADAFRALHKRGHSSLRDVRAILHFGACTSTTTSDRRYVLKNNYLYSRDLLSICQQRRVPLIYASSAAVYGNATCFREDAGCEAPLNLYAYSKHLFDRCVRSYREMRSQVVGLRFFNVYGPGEAHKGAMASMVYQLFQQLREFGTLRLFQGTRGFSHGEQRRDFVHVSDAVAVTLWFLHQPTLSGIYNVGSGRSRSFNEIARCVKYYCGHGLIRYIPMPPALEECYQAFTQADLSRLRKAGYSAPFVSIEQGIPNYLHALSEIPPTTALSLGVA